MDPFVAEIRIFPLNFAPKGWAFCNNQLLPISQNTALFSLVGTMYGGDGKSNFALPGMQGNAPMFWGQGPGLSQHYQGEISGSDTVQLLQAEMPSHNHGLQANFGQANLATPSPARSFARTNPGTSYKDTTTNLTSMNFGALGLTGGDQPHNNLMPYLTLNFCIALQGVFPPRS